MRKSNLFLCLSLCAMTLVGFQSCDKDEDAPPLPTVTGTEVVIKATEWNKWHYFSFSTGKEVGVGETSDASNLEWKSKSNWDIAFHMSNVRTNSGFSGNGQGGAIEVANATSLANVTTAPESGYTTDESLIILTAMPPVYDTMGTNLVLQTWTTKVGMDYIPANKIFVVKTADGKYAKIFLKDIRDSNGENDGTITMEYTYQADGSRNF